LEAVPDDRMAPKESLPVAEKRMVAVGWSTMLPTISTGAFPA
jgi:hypothetical protein